MALIPLKVSHAWEPEVYARLSGEQRSLALRGPMADALVGIGRLTTRTEDAPLDRFQMGTHSRRRIVETLEIWVDPLAAHTKAAAESSRVAFLTNDDLARRMLEDRAQELAKREEKLSKDLAELEAMRRELRDDRQRVIQEFHGYDECAGRR